MKQMTPKRIHQALLAMGAAALLIVVTPEIAAAKEKRSPEQTRPSHGATSTRPSTSSGSNGSSGSRTRVGSSGSSRSTSGRASANRTSNRPTQRSRQTASSGRSHRTSTSSSSHGVVSRHSPYYTRRPHTRDSYRYRGRYSYGHGYGYGYSYFPYYGWGYGADWAHSDLYWSRYYRPFWGGWWGSYWDWFFYTGYTPGRYRGERHDGYVSRSGALDLDVSPEEAEVWIDGEYLGRADDYDGFPEYLWLPSGGVTVTLYLEGYETITRDYDLRPGDVIRIRDEMRHGESIHPEGLRGAPEPTVERSRQPKPYSGASSYREDREIRNSERRGEAESRRSAEESWREREASANDDLAVGRLFVSVVPDDASVYLDGIFLGLGRELSQLSAGLVVAPGEHLLEVVRPGFENEAREFDMESDGSLEIEIDLDRN